MGEAVFYNLHHVKANYEYDWNAAFNNQDFINMLLASKSAVTFGSSYLSIPDHEFQRVYSYSGMTFYSCYMDIGVEAFADMLYLKSVVIQSSKYDGGYYKIKQSAFRNCRDLQYISLSTYRDIESDAFKDCNELITFYMGSGRGNIVSDRYVNIDAAFSNLKSLSYISIQMVDDILPYAFANCTALSSLINLGCSYIKKVHSHAFEGCTNLLSVVLAQGVANSDIAKRYFDRKVEIDSYAFSGCTKLTSFTCSIIHNINDYAFYECSSLSTIYLNYAAMYSRSYANESTMFYKPIISGNAFSTCTNLRYVTIYDGGDILTGTYKDKPYLSSVIYSTWSSASRWASYSASGCLKHNIETGAFENCPMLSSVYLSFVGSIGSRAFNNVALGYFYAGYCDYVDEEAFYSCSNLLYISLNTSVYKYSSLYSDWSSMILSFHSRAFEGCPKLSSICVCNISKIDSGMFSGNSTLKYFSCSFSYSSWFNPYTMTLVDIGDYAFYSCSVSVAYFSAVTRIGSHAFDVYSSNYRFIYAGDWLCNEIGEYAFANNTSISNGYSHPIYVNSLCSLVSEGNPCHIGSHAFESARAIQSSIYLYDITGIDEYAFNAVSYYFYNLSIYGYNHSNKSQSTYISNYAFANCAYLSKVIISDIDDIYSHAFESCASQAYISFISLYNVLNIGEYAFNNCKAYGFSYLSITGLCLNISNYAFANCSRLSSIYLLTDSMISLASIDAFESISTTYKITVPASLYNDYINDPVWGLLSASMISQA